jgi:hypothetical protein
MRSYVADFETTTTEKNCFVWAYGLCEIGYRDNIHYGTNIDDFMSWCERQRENVKIYFHNLKFDGQFILSWLFKNGFTHASEPRERATRTFTTLISDKGMYYSIEVIFKLQGKNINKVTFQDSLKLIPLSVDKIAKAFKLPFTKGKIDYDKHNNLPPGTALTLEEIDYITTDVEIVATALEYFFEQGLTKMTIGANALADYRRSITDDNFDRWFPTPKYHQDVKQSYKGGFTWLNPIYRSKLIGKGIVLDVNSLYPSVMKSCLLPYGTPIFFEGQYKPDKVYPLYTQMLRCQFELKPGKIPTIQVKKSLWHSGGEYLTSSNYEQIPLCLNSVDLELFFENYDVYNVEYISGWKFKAAYGLFDSYIDKWNNIKIQAKKDGNAGLYTIAKYMLNSLYGKFGTDIKQKSKIPKFKNGVVEYETTPAKYRDGIYIAMASFITSYARRVTISAFQMLQDDYNNKKSKAIPIYADTDSLHIWLNGETIESFFKKCTLEIDNEKLGAWKFESKFTKGKFLRQKCYIEMSSEDVTNPNPDYKLKVTVAGMPEPCYEQVTFDNFKIGAVYTGKKQPELVNGGVILVNVDFTINK